MKYIIVTIFCLFLLPLVSLGASVIELGACNGSFTPIKWSPDGSRIAFFRDGQIVLSDTSGNQSILRQKTFQVRAFEWIDNDRLLIYDILSMNRDSVVYELLGVGLTDGVTKSLYMYKRRGNRGRGGRNGGKVLLPHRTTEGLLYYTKYDHSGGVKNVFPEAKVGVDVRSQSLFKGTVLKALTDGLYLVSLDQVDTTKVFDRPINNSIINRSHTYVMSGGTIIRLSDGQQTILDTMITEIPDSTYGCGFDFISFSESGNVVAFVRSCDDGHMYVVSQAGLYDINRSKLIMLDDATGLTNINKSVISANERFVAFRSEGKAFIWRIDM